MGWKKVEDSKWVNKESEQVMEIERVKTDMGYEETIKVRDRESGIEDNLKTGKFVRSNAERYRENNPDGFRYLAGVDLSKLDKVS